MIQVDGIFVQQGGGGPVIPDFTYTGEYQLVNEADGNWKLYLITSGTFTPNVDMLVDACVFGGGQAGHNGGKSTSNNITSSPGGQPGMSATSKNIVLEKDHEYVCTIGSGGEFGGIDGGTTTFYTVSATGGSTNNGITSAAPEFGESGNYTQAALGGAGGAVSRGSPQPGFNGGNAGSADSVEYGGNGGAANTNGGDGSKGAKGGGVGKLGNAAGGGGGGGGYGAGGGAGGALFYANPSATIGLGGAGAPGVAILRNARGAAA